MDAILGEGVIRTVQFTIVVAWVGTWFGTWFASGRGHPRDGRRRLPRHWGTATVLSTLFVLELVLVGSAGR